MESETASLEPFQMLTLAESVIPLAANSVASDEINSTSSSFTTISSTQTTTTLPDSGLISQSVDLITTLYSSGHSSVEMCEEKSNADSKSFSPSENFSLDSVFHSQTRSFAVESVYETLPNSYPLPSFALNLSEAEAALFRMDFLPSSVVDTPESSSENALDSPENEMSLITKNGMPASFQLDSISTLVSPKKYNSLSSEFSPAANNVSNMDSVPFIHRSVSSPIFGSSMKESLECNSEDSSITIVINGENNSSRKSAKKRKAQIDMCFPEAEPPALRPRFQWYQSKGMLRLHILVKNVLPIDAKIVCTGRHFEFRCKTDECPYPPTRPELPPRPIVEYHLPLRLPHRLHPEPEFVRFSPTRVEINYRKVKPLVEWSCLWKPALEKNGMLNGSEKEYDSLNESSSESDTSGDSDDDEEMERPTKRFMNGESPGRLTPLPVIREIVAPALSPLSNRDQTNSPQSAVFTVGSTEVDIDADSGETVSSSSRTAVVATHTNEVENTAEQSSLWNGNNNDISDHFTESLDEV